MKKKAFVFALFSTLSTLLFISFAWAWSDGVTHKDLTDHATDQSVLSPNGANFLRKIGFEKNTAEVLLWEGHHCDDRTHETNCRIIDWLKYGAEKEDAAINIISGRFNNHFHDPLSGKGIDDYEIFGILNYHVSGESCLEWAQDTQGQSRLNDATGEFYWPEGDQSWSTLRGLYYIALTQTDDGIRKETFAQLFKGLGHQMHLLQDMAVPSHVRNDSHPWETTTLSDNLIIQQLGRRSTLYFETWAAKNRKEIIDFASATGKDDFPAVSYDLYYTGAPPSGVAQSQVSQLWDANIYNGTNPSATTAQGLSEYTNANFFSDDTIFAADYLDPSDPHYFPYPKATSTDWPNLIDLLPEQIISEAGSLDYKLYLSKTGDGEGGTAQGPIGHFVRVGYFAKPLINDAAVLPTATTFYRTFYLDEACHQAYAAKLVPRAVGYSAALLNYFFRGELDIKKAYFTYGDDLSLSGMGLEFKNISPPLKPGLDVEPLSNGQIDLVYRYLAPGEETNAAAQGKDPVFTYGSVADIYSVTDDTDPINTEYVIAQQAIVFDPPIPAGATKISFSLVYLGTLGDEQKVIRGRC